MAEGRYAFLNSVAHKNFMDQYNWFVLSLSGPI
jgi:hypothetical protein